MLPTPSDSVAQGDRPPFGLPTVLRFARFRVIYISLALISLQVRRETAQTAKGWPFLLLPSFAVALLRLPATINHTRVFPRPLAATNNAETRDLGLKTRGGTPNCTPVVARLGIPLAASYQGAMRALSKVANSARARPRKTVIGRTDRFDRFLLFSASPECQMEGRFQAMAENCGNRSRAVSQSCGQPLRTTQSDSVGNIQNGLQVASSREADLPAHSQPSAKPLCVSKSEQKSPLARIRGFLIYYLNFTRKSVQLTKWLLTTLQAL